MAPFFWTTSTRPMRRRRDSPITIGRVLPLGSFVFLLHSFCFVCRSLCFSSTMAFHHDVASGLLYVSLMWIAFAVQNSEPQSFRGDFPWLVSFLSTIPSWLPQAVDEATFHWWCIVGLVGSMVFSFGILMSGVEAAYGRYNVGNRSNFWGFNINGRAAWIMQESPTLIVPFFCWRYASPVCRASLANRILLGLFIVHYINRTCVFPLLLRGGKPTPVSVMLSAFTFCSLNAYIQARWLCTLHEYPDTWLQNPQFLLGVTLFVAGFIINNHADHILRNLRPPGDKGYYIPTGGMFTYVSGANFFGEIVEWTGFAIASNSWAGAAFCFATFLNTAPRGYQHHQWYKAKFGDEYPQGRKAVIPFVW